VRRSNFHARVAEIRQKLAPGMPIELWCQDKMRRPEEQTHLSLGQADLGYRVAGSCINC
jgi:hypothetical protein